MTSECLGNTVIDGYTVVVENDISGYHIRPSKDGLKVTYMLLSDTTGTPDWVFKNFGVKNFKTGFRNLMDYVKAL